jgi:hypothetical protein
MRRIHPAIWETIALLAAMAFGLLVGITLAR